MKKKIMNNLDLKLIALFFSVVLWLIVVNIDDPVKSVMFSGIEVKILNADELEGQGKVYEILDDTGVVDVTIKGRRSIVEDISKENIKAVADMRDLTSMSTISIVVTSNKYSGEIDDIKCDIANVKLNIEDLKKIQKPIHVESVGEPENGYVLGSLTANLNQVYIEGPESLVNQVVEAKAQLQVDNVTSTVSSSVPIRLYDAEGKEIEDARLSMNIDVVSVQQEILYTKVVPIRYEVNGKPAEGYAATGEVTSDITEIMVAGRKSLLDSLEAITIPSSILNLEGVNSDLVKEVQMSHLLPANVVLVENGFDGIVKVTVDVEREVFEEFTFEKEDISILNLPGGYTAEILNDGNYITTGATTLRVYGLSEILDGINMNSVKVQLDMGKYMRDNSITSLEEGTYYLTPEFGLPEGAYVRDNFKIQVRISKK